MTEHKREYMKKYRAEHKDSIKENRKKYYLSPKEYKAFLEFKKITLEL